MKNTAATINRPMLRASLQSMSIGYGNGRISDEQANVILRKHETRLTLAPVQRVDGTTYGLTAYGAALLLGILDAEFNLSGGDSVS